MKTAVWGTSRELGIYLFTKKPPPSNSGSANYEERGQAIPSREYPFQKTLHFGPLREISMENLQVI